MRRLAIEPRPGWQKKAEAVGLHHHTLGGVPYWDESACYSFGRAEIDTLERATYALQEMCLAVVQEIFDERLFGLFLVPPEFEDYVYESWENDDPSLYGRFDLAYDGVGPPKLLEYNADTPTALVEAGVAQWFWLKEFDERGDQFNSIHERLLEAWAALKEKDDRPTHFAALSGIVEDYVTVEYLRDTAIQAGLRTAYIDVEQIGVDPRRDLFIDQAGRPIERCFKLYPWEWMIREEFGGRVRRFPTRWIEPPWKMLLSCKSILPLLWERYPDSPFLLPASFEPLEGSFVKKPVHAREGSNITVVRDGRVVQQTDGPYNAGPWVYQGLAPLRSFDGRYPIVGSWVINGWACGIGIREDDALVTRNTSRFVPHMMTD